MKREAVYAKVTAAILERLEAGVAPWHKPWSVQAPANYISKRKYTGVNALALGMLGRSPYWLTFNQIRSNAYHLKSGSKGAPVLFATTNTVKDAVTNTKGDIVVPALETPIVKVFHVFNAADVEGIPETATVARAWEPLEAADRLVAGIQPPPVIRHDGAQAFFDPKADAITLPPRSAFPSAAAYNATQFHELTHWTGHQSRLDRPSLVQAVRFGDRSYSLEELVAQMGAGFLCAMSGLENDAVDQSASYIQSWLNVLRESPAILVKAASQAQKAVDFLVPVSA